MQIIRQRIDGVFVIEPSAIVDARGFFSEIWHRRVLSENGIDVDFVQENMSLSKCANTVRGLHYQSAPHAQAKLVRVSKGRILDVAVDLRPNSPTYSEWVGVELSAENKLQLFIPQGFLHGFVTREPDTEVIYKCSDYYRPECEGAVHFSDPDIGIDWGIQEKEAVLSLKDATAPRLRELATSAAQGAPA